MGTIKIKGATVIPENDKLKVIDSGKIKTRGTPKKDENERDNKDGMIV